MLPQAKNAELSEQKQNVLIFLLEDDPDMAREISAELSETGYLVKVFNNEMEARKAAQSEESSLLIVDRMLSGTDSLEMIEHLRAVGIATPVLFVTALASVEERIRGLRAGGDDYISKPFAMGEFMARVEALLRRRPIPIRETYLQVGPLKLDLIERRVWRGTREITLLPKEFKLLEYLVRHRGQTVTRAMLLEDVWHYPFLKTNVVDVQLSKVRRKLDQPGDIPLIRNIRAEGFILDANE